MLGGAWWKPNQNQFSTHNAAELSPHPAVTIVTRHIGLSKWWHETTNDTQKIYMNYFIYSPLPHPLLSPSYSIEPPPHSSSTTLPTPHLRPRHSISSRHGIININHQPWIRGLICTRERNKRPRSPTPTISNSDLGTRDIELRSVGRRSGVQTDMFDAEEVVTWGCGGWDCEFGFCEAFWGVLGIYTRGKG